MHLGSPDRPRRPAVAPQSAQIMVEQPPRNRHRRPRRSHLCLEAATASDPRPDRLRLHADLSLPCPAARHAPASDRHRPVQFVAFKPNERIELVRNADYWKPGRPYLDGIEYTIIPNRSTAILAFVAGKFDLTFPYELTVPLLKDV